MEVRQGNEYTSIFFKNTVPVAVHLELTNACNLYCQHCLIQPKKVKDELTFKEVCFFLDQLAELGALEMVFSGGEPLLRPDFFEILRIAQEKDFVLTILTNATLIEVQVVKKLKTFPIKEVSTSLYGAKASTHDGITQKKGSFEKTLRAIDLLVKEGLKTRVKTSIMKQNLEEVKEIERLVLNLGAAWEANPLIFPCIDGSKEPLVYRLDDEDLEKLWGRPEGRRLPKGEEQKEKGFNLTGMCGAGSIICAISAQGEVYPCAGLRIKIGDLRKERFQDFWFSSKTLKRLRNLKDRDFKECYHCELRLNCVKCPGLAWQEEGDLLAPAQESCRLAKIRARGGVYFEERIPQAGVGQT